MENPTELLLKGVSRKWLQTEAEMTKAIRKGGHTLVQRNTSYEPNRVLVNMPAANETEPPLAKSKVLEGNLVTA